MICKISIKIFLQQLHDIDPLVTPSEMVDILFLPPRSCHPLGIILVPRYSTEQPSQGWDGNNTKLCHASYYWVTASEGESPFEKPS